MLRHNSIGGQYVLDCKTRQTFLKESSTGKVPLGVRRTKREQKTATPPDPVSFPTLSILAALMYSAMDSAELKWISLVLARALQLKPQRRFVALLVEVGDVELAACFDARACIEIELQDGAIPDIPATNLPQAFPSTAPPAFPKGRGFHRQDRTIRHMRSCHAPG